MRNSSVKRISGYGVAVAAVLGSTSAHADVVFVDVNPDATGSTNAATPSVLLSFSLTGVVATDGSHVAGEQFFFNHTYNASAPNYSKLQINNNGATAFDNRPLAYGTLIGPGQTSYPTSTGSDVLTGHFGVGAKGNWSNGQEAFIGLKFDNSGAPNYGWADITVNGPASITLHSFAYDNTGSLLAAGDPNPVPEPSQIALFAIGATGIAAYRRRKQAVAVSK
ncbi:MAG TPA: PEP-CTERM sorting domain-containing protein [Verrucomicrobiae bacterium]|nr:PEP-CTERM sorting domain-containing protein [Verrucomicrobiae bacterium]